MARTKGVKPTADQVITFRVTSVEADALTRKLGEQQTGRKLSRAGYCRSLLVRDLGLEEALPEPHTEEEPVRKPERPKPLDVEALRRAEESRMREIPDDEIRELFGDK